MAKKEETKPAATAAATEKSSIEKWIDGQTKMTTEHVAAAAKMRKEKLDEKRTREVDGIIEQLEYKTNKQILIRQKSSKKEDAEKNFLKQLSVIDDKGNVVGGLLHEVMNGEHDTTSYKKRYQEIRQAYQKELNAIEDHYDEYQRKLEDAFPNYSSIWDWCD